MAETYFIWKNIDSRNMGVVVTDYPPIIRPKERVTEKTRPGVAGSLHVSEGEDVYDTYVRACQCYTRPAADISAVIAWLRGSSQAVFGNEPTMAYTARIDNQISLDKMMRNHPHRSFTIPFVCQPFKQLKTPAADIVKTISGQTITNPGTVFSLPIIKVEGSGDATLSVGGAYFELEGLTGGIIIDSTMPECFNLDRSALLNDLMTGEFPTIKTGTSIVSWTGNITEVTITPNWRWL